MSKRKRKNSANYTWFAPEDCYPVAYAPHDGPPGTYCVDGIAIGLSGSSRQLLVIEVTTHEGYNGMWHMPHNECHRIDKVSDPATHKPVTVPKV